MKADYGIRALLDLAERFGEAPVPSHDIAARQHVPGPFLDQLLMTLRRAGLVRSTRGPRGGHMLSRAPELVTLGQAIDILEGQAAQMECFSAPETCEHSFGCSIRSSLLRAEDAIREVLDGTTLADMVRDRQRQGVFHGIYKPLPTSGGPIPTVGNG
ncbi:MAG TPA: Rrf2 family transcriptional regulator [Candidatus Dormibacteraeota bacterium]|nr:Rrf2 family transcriptional regulator [Candidatus Dormibacteraeota bacterium]